MSYWTFAPEHLPVRVKGAAAPGRRAFSVPSIRDGGVHDLRHHGDSGEGPRFLVVPRTPGPLIDPEPAARERARDDVDEIVDELFGPEIEGGPGWTDGILLIAGVALAVSGAVLFDSRVLTIVGVVAIGLGLILPIRTGWRAWQAHRAAERRQASL